jgi:hypothetical protein
VNGDGSGGQFCDFSIHHNPNNTISLIGTHTGYHLGFEFNGSARHPARTHHGVHGQFQIIHLD